ncbi:hypothetical protein PoB_002220300 [Plakobranchus ocellatus]|uniref:Uncharacterized protein n=1 Tax=Plakobranchus ocellatus TaxID=259542 RepID=A0AAV3ZM84_9GAST|nr:hypothetical protein PoB_002220300 [Plakobranchus ocellatus]
MKSSKHDKGSLHTKLARFQLSYRNAHRSTRNESPTTLMNVRRLLHLDLIRPDITSKVITKLWLIHKPIYAAFIWESLSQPVTIVVTSYGNMAQFMPVQLS